MAGDSVNVNATANYDTPNIGNNKQITVIYTISGADAGKYLAPTIDSSFIGAIINSPIPTPTPTSPSSS
ncbi:MAG: YDG domain-containing protein [Candidatus Peribacteria bacterium]|nr:YDG domain-containing protein [Candidatus Peribacteria bacterium]